MIYVKYLNFSSISQNYFCFNSGKSIDFIFFPIKIDFSYYKITELLNYEYLNSFYNFYRGIRYYYFFNPIHKELKVKNVDNYYDSEQYLYYY